MKYWVDGSHNIPSQYAEIIGHVLDPDTGEAGFQVRFANGNIDFVSPELVSPQLNPAIPLFLQGTSNNNHTEIAGSWLSTTPQPTFAARASVPNLAETLSYLSGQPVQRDGSEFFDENGLSLGKRYDYAWLQTMQRAPDREFLDSLRGELGPLLQKNSGGKSIQQWVQSTDNPEAFQKNLPKYARRLIRQAGYASPGDFWFDAQRLINAVEGPLNQNPTPRPHLTPFEPSRPLSVRFTPCPQPFSRPQSTFPPQRATEAPQGSPAPHPATPSGSLLRASRGF